MSTIKLSINNQQIEVPKGITVLQACEIAGLEVPRFCYHDRLKIAGNCRMCLVEIKGGPPKPAASCAMPAAENMVVFTDSPMVKKAREGVMEFLLINHPLDCPICDQGGECDLQDQAMAYGRGGNRFDENKRAVPDKYLGPLVKTSMNRCIHCTRCIRFMEDVAGVPALGAVNRGEDMQVTNFIEKGIDSEMSGNIIDLCPVGALTSKPYAFKARSWELQKVESIDVHDAVGSNIRVDFRGREVMRVLPRLNEDVNEEWISDKSRFACDGLKTQRLDRPMVRKNGRLEAVTWTEAYNAIAKRLKNVKGNKIAAIAGDMADVESMTALKALMEKMDSPNIDCRQDGAKIEAGARGSYLFNTTIAGIEQADAVLLIGANPRREAAIINARLRKRFVAGGLKVATIGPKIDLTFKVDNLGDSAAILEEIASGKHAFAKVLQEAKNPIIIVGAAAYTRKDGAAILNVASELAEKFGIVKDGWNGFNILHTAASRVGGLDIGFVPGKGGLDVEGILESAEKDSIEVVYLLGADEIDTAKLEHAFVIYQGHHGDKGAHAADVILPGAAYTEKNATYVNVEGRVQRTQLAVFPPGEAKEDWKIIVELADVIGESLNAESLKHVRDMMVKLAPHLADADTIKPAVFKKSGKKGKVQDTPIGHFFTNFYMTDVISRVSPTMAKCTEEFVKKSKKLDPREAA
ncbi:MAG: NADH-quinone oxidoreductase subunit G [Proteobacteria bacterium]|nr:NADH-quinone oxidoreductase subunit G [Pseudomonadota bacterium]